MVFWVGIRGSINYNRRTALATSVYDGSKRHPRMKLRISPGNCENGTGGWSNHTAVTALLEGLALGSVVKAKAPLRPLLFPGHADI